MRVASVNLQSCRPNSSFVGGAGTTECGFPGGSGVVDRARHVAARQLAALCPDVVAFQEVRQVRGDAVVEDFAAAASLPYAEFLPARRWRDWLRVKLFGRRDEGYGIGLAARWPLADVEAVRLPVVQKPWRRGRGRGVLGWSWRFEEPRVALIATIWAGAGACVVAATHLAPRSDINAVQLGVLEARICEYVRRMGLEDAPQMLVGDLNMGRRYAEECTSLALMADAATFPDDEPSTQIDHVLGRGWKRVGEPMAVRLAISDHRALVVDLERV